MYRQDTNRLGVLVYEPRSGSTIISKFITENMNAFVLPECSMLISILTRYHVDQNINVEVETNIIKIISRDRKISDWGIEKEAKTLLTDKKSKKISDFIKRIVEILKKKYAPAKYLILKKESYLIVFHQLLEIFSDLDIIFVVRDPRAVFASQKNSLYTLTNQPFSTSSIKTAFSWNLQFRRLRSIETDKAEQFIIKYENFVINPKESLKSMKMEDFENGNTQEISYLLPRKYKTLHKNVLTPPNHKISLNWESNVNWYEKLLIELICYKNMRSMEYKTSKLSNLLHFFKLTMCIEYLQSLVFEIFRFSSELSWSRGMIKVDPK